MNLVPLDGTVVSGDISTELLFEQPSVLLPFISRSHQSYEEIEPQPEAR